MNANTGRDLKNIVTTILRETEGVVAIYLFGSVAKGTESELSDYDIGVFVNEYPVEDIDVMARIRLKLLGKIGRPLEVIFFDLKDLEYSSPILYEIYHHNRLVFGENVILRGEQAVRKMRPMARNGEIVGFYVED
jgi:predicted nucleotidyltransferase